MASSSPGIVSFQRDILPLFTRIDIDHMKDQGVDLDDYTYLSNPDHAQAVYDAVSSGEMPPTWDGGAGPWSTDKVSLFKEWMDGGYAP